MKRLFMWLAVINLALAGVIWLRESPAENTRLKQQLNPDKIRPVPAEKVAAMPPRPGAQGKSSAALATEQKSAEPLKAPEPSKGTGSTELCFEWGKLSASAAPRAEKALASLKTENRVQKREDEQSLPGYWVYVPSLGSRADAQAKLQEIRSLGAKDAYIMDGSDRWRNAIALATFDTEERAQRHLAEMKSRGIPNAQMAQRTQPDGYAFIVRSGDPRIEQDLTQLQKQFPQSQLGKVACG
jgi:hypothetical protein